MLMLKNPIFNFPQFILGPKNHTRKINNIHKNFELQQVFMPNFLCQNIPIFPLHILLVRRIETFWSEGIEHFGLEILEQLGIKNHKQKINNIHKDLLHYTNFSCIIFCATLSRNFTYQLQTTQTTYYLNNLVLCHYPHQIIYF